MSHIPHARQRKYLTRTKANRNAPCLLYGQGPFHPFPSSGFLSSFIQAYPLVNINFLVVTVLLTKTHLSFTHGKQVKTRKGLLFPRRPKRKNFVGFFFFFYLALQLSIELLLILSSSDNTLTTGIPRIALQCNEGIFFFSYSTSSHNHDFSVLHSHLVPGDDICTMRFILQSPQ